MQRRKFITLTSAAVAATSTLLLGGCVTHDLHEASKRQEIDYYSETVKQVLITQDEKSIVIIGAKHHYIVDAPETLVQAIRSGFHKHLRARFGTFDVDHQANLSGSLVLMLGADATQQECEEADSLGFKVPEKPDADVQRRRGYRLEGKRYLAGDFQLPSQAKPLNQSYDVTVRETKSTGGKAVLAALLTPVTLAADGALILLGIPLIPVFLAYVYVTDTKFCCG